MGICWSSGKRKVPAPMPETIEEWTRADPKFLISCHLYLSELYRKEHHQQNDSGVKIDVLQYSADPAVSGDMFREQLYSLRDSRASLLKTLKHPQRRDYLIHQWDYCRVVSFVLANTVLLPSTAPSARAAPIGTKRFKHRVALALDQVHSLLPDLAPSRVDAMLQLFIRLNSAGSGRLEDAEVDRWMYNKGQKAAITDSVFFPLFFKIATATKPGTYTAPEWCNAIDRLCTFTEAQLARWAFFELACVGSSPRVPKESAHDAGKHADGKGGKEKKEEEKTGEIPYIAVSSLVRVFKDMRNAARDRTHVSRKLLEQIHKQVKLAAAGQKAASAYKKEQAYAALVNGQSRPSKNTVGAWIEECATEGDWGRLTRAPGRGLLTGRRRRSSLVGERLLAAGEGGSMEFGDGRRSSTHATTDDGGDGDRASFTSARQYSRRGSDDDVREYLPKGETVDESCHMPLATGAADLLSFEDFAHICRNSPYAVFDLLYLQVHFRKALFGETWWKKRTEEVQAHALKHAGYSGAGTMAFWGYEGTRFRPLPSPFSAPNVPHLMRVEPLQVPMSVRYALATGDHADVCPPLKWTPPPSSEYCQPLPYMPGGATEWPSSASEIMASAARGGTSITGKPAGSAVAPSITGKPAGSAVAPSPPQATPPGLARGNTVRMETKGRRPSLQMSPTTNPTELSPVSSGGGAGQSRMFPQPTPHGGRRPSLQPSSGGATLPTGAPVLSPSAAQSKLYGEGDFLGKTPKSKRERAGTHGGHEGEEGPAHLHGWGDHGGKPRRGNDLGFKKTGTKRDLGISKRDLGVSRRDLGVSKRDLGQS